MSKSVRQKLFQGWPGCSNHGCIVRGEIRAMGRNSTCQCLVNARSGSLIILQQRLDAVIKRADVDSVRITPGCARFLSGALDDYIEKNTDFLRKSELLDSYRSRLFELNDAIAKVCSIPEPKEVKSE